jgi:hypothetical protein
MSTTETSGERSEESFEPDQTNYLIDKDLQDEFYIWRLIFEKIISYSDLSNLNFVDCLKLNCLLDYKIFKEQEEIKNN